MKIKKFKGSTDDAKLVINSLSVKLDKAKINVEAREDRAYPDEVAEKDRTSIIMIEITARISDKDSVAELKQLINQSEL